MQKRNANLDLLKIVLIIMIIALHYFNSAIGGLLGEVNKWEVNYILGHILQSICIIAANVFVIITGYYSVKKTSIKISKPIKLFAIMIFYGIVLFLVYYFIERPAISFGLIYEFLTYALSRWFIVTYCILYLLIPYINKLVNNISKKELGTLIIINTIFFYIWHTFFTSTTLVDGGYGIINFINLYLVGAYIKLYKDNLNRKGLFIGLFLLCTILTTLGSFFASRVWDYATIFNLIASISLFMIFKNINIKSSGIITKLSTYSLAIYIIHEYHFTSKYLYQTIFRSDLYWHSNFMILHLLITVVGIFIICTIIEFIRKNTIGKIMDNNIDKIKYEIKC